MTARRTNRRTKKANVRSQNKFLLIADRLQTLVEVLQSKDYSVIGPVAADNAVVYKKISSVTELPRGRTDSQSPGRYRLTAGRPGEYFGYALGPHTWKSHCFPAQKQLWSLDRQDDKFTTAGPDDSAGKTALLGVRPCELQALAVLDRVLAGGPYIDQDYELRRRNSFIVAVNCTHPGGTCFCASMDCGPRAKDGFDLVLTEVMEASEHYFVVESGTAAGERLLDELQLGPAGPAQVKTAGDALDRAAADMGRTLAGDNLAQRLYDKIDDSDWEEATRRCLSCGNCTMVCPTCFCTNIQDSTDLSGAQVFRTRIWDSCFTLEHSYIHGGSVRTTPASRYRQWLMHKLVYWSEQFGLPGCVGCGRCITWCPVGIDIREVAGKIIT